MNTKERRRPAGTRTRKADDVVYTQPGPFRKERFFLQLLTVVAVVLAFCKRSLILVAASSCVAVFLTEQLLRLL